MEQCSKCGKPTEGGTLCPDCEKEQADSVQPEVVEQPVEEKTEVAEQVVAQTDDKEEKGKKGKKG